MVTVRVVYENGVLRLLDPLDGVEEGLAFDATLEPIAGERQNQEAAFILNMHEGAMIMADDFDDPLPDSFWLGESDE